MNQTKINGKNPEETMVIMTELVLPNDTNLLGNLLGGRLMHWMDIAGALAASRHANKPVATVSVDNLIFKHPVKMGSMITLRAKIVYVGKTSIHTFVDVFSEDLRTGDRLMTNTAKLVFVALDDMSHPSPVVPLIPQTSEEIRIFNEIHDSKIKH